MKIDEMPKGIKKYLSAHQKQKRWLAVVVCLACAVVFCTVYALVLPAIALEGDQMLNCSYEIHQHEESCYDEEGNLVCPLEEADADKEKNQHNDECVESVDADEEIVPMSAGGNGKVPESVLEQLAEEYGIYPGIVDENGVWTALNGKNETDATIKTMVTLPKGTEADENSYLYIREVIADENAGYYPDQATIKNTVGEYNDYQCYAIHWVKIYRDDTAHGGDYTDSDGNIGKVYEVDGEKWVCIYGTNSVLNDENAKATVKIEYLKKSAYLTGNQAHRKLRIFNSRDKEGKTLEENATATGVTANDKAYTGFTFETNRGGPYVFVSQKVFEGYVSDLTVTSMADGTEPFDSDNSAGNDSADNNKIVRSYDIIQYNLTATLAARQSGVTAESADLYFEMAMDADLTEASFDTSKMLWMESNYTIYYLNDDGMVLYWQNAEAYRKGDYYYIGSSAVNPMPTSVSDIEVGAVAGSNKAQLNAIVSHSTDGIDSYTSGVTKQQLVGHAVMTAGSSSTDKNVLAAQETLSAAVQVLNAANNSTLRPEFKVWLDGNEDNYGSESGSGGSVQLSPVVTANQVESAEVTISSEAKFNLELKKNKNVTYRGWFDNFKGLEITDTTSETYIVNGQTVTGKELYTLLEKAAALPENKGKANPEDFIDKGNACKDCLAEGLSLADYKDIFSKIRYGRITGYGLTLQTYNSAASDNDTAAKGFKGITLPQGDITFAVDLATSVKPSGNAEVDKSQYYPMLWEYSENENVKTNYEYTYADPNIGENGKITISGDYKGNIGRNMYWAYLDSTCYAAWSATYNGLYVGKGDTVHSDYYGGKWSLADNSNNFGYEFTVKDYDFNFTSAGMIFPTTKAGNSGASEGYNAYIGCFSSGQIQVLNVFPRYQTATVNVGTTVTVRDMTLTTTDRKNFSPDTDAQTRYEHETNTGDNLLKDDIPLYEPGKMAKANAFCTKSFFDNRETANLAGSNYFLGTYFWDTGYDCSAFAGQDITLVGAARIDAGDYAIRSMNLLQLFDSKALNLDLTKGDPYVVSTVNGAVKGETRILYAADPDYKDGYDSNNKDVLNYMSTVREEDLIYYDSLEKLEDDGYTCIGVMAELRGWTIHGEGGYSTVLKIPMTASDSTDYVGKTVATVNTVRIWTNLEDMKDISWKDGKYNATTGQNSVAGYVATDFGSIDHYSGQVANGSAYEKTEYENGQVKLGSNTGGYVYGSSLLILGYHAEVDIEVDKTTGGTGYPTYDLDKGQYTVDYWLKGIIARPSDIGKSQETKTALTVTARLDENYTSDKDYTAEKQRIAVANGTYKMNAAERMVLYETDENGNVKYDTDRNPITADSVAISDSSENPATVCYALLNEAGEVVKDSDGNPIIYTIKAYAAPDTNGTEVVFYLSNVTVGASVPEITFDAEIKPTMVKNNDSIKANAYISGTSDVRAYSEVNGNMDSTTIGIIQLGATRLVKSVDTRYIELDGEIKYTVTYTNSGSGALGTMYLNDLLPDNSDNRGSKYTGALELTGVNAYLSGEKEFSADVTFYYSTTPYKELREAVDLSNASNRNPQVIEEMLRNYFNELGQILSGSSGVIYSDAFNMMSDKEKAEITGIYAVVEGLQGGNSINLEITTKALDNAAGDVYKNVAYSWISGSDSVELVSNQVETTVLSRTISGVVWHDANLNGVRDNDGSEKTISGIKCTLFKWDEDAKQYTECTKDVTGGDITVVTTGADGGYNFTKLSAGQYIVAFSGDALQAYTGATTYQKNEIDTTVNNDAVALGKTGGSLDTEISNLELGGEYKYAIAYNLTDDGTVDNVSLHLISDIVSKNITLTNHVEWYANLDCGLVIAGYELPETGGSGTTIFIIGGLLLMAGTVGCGYRLRRRREGRD